MPKTLDDLPNGARATVLSVTDLAGLGGGAVHRLLELGFLPGEPLTLLRRGPGGREPLAVQVGESLYALRQVEARCIEVAPSGVPA